MAGDDTNKHDIVPDGTRKDEQPLEHVRPLAPEQPNDPGKPVEGDEMPIPVPAGPIV
jgi:hypothetical protein